MRKITKLLISIISIVTISINLNALNAKAEEREVYLGGFTAGFVLNTTTVEVVGMCEIMTESGAVCPARECGVKTGDVIKRINDKEVTCMQDLNTIINFDYKSYEMTIVREGKSEIKEIKPVVDKKSGSKKLGMLVKDTINGIGTVTYVDKYNNTFASLGHPITDKMGNLYEINGGNIFDCVIYDVKKGLRGNPGELRGAFEGGSILGIASKNNISGIYGKLSSDYELGKMKSIKTAEINEVKPGKAEIYSTLDGKNIKSYDISIVKVDENNKENRNFVIKIDDKELIESAGGIVQGMSGSPIVQNGKLVGAITHVFINDPTRGYGISIQNMLNS